MEPYLKEISCDHQFDNPKLKCLQETLLGTFHKKEDSRAIIFVKVSSMSCNSNNRLISMRNDLLMFTHSLIS